MSDGKMTGETAATIKKQENGCVGIGERRPGWQWQNRQASQCQQQDLNVHNWNALSRTPMTSGEEKKPLRIRTISQALNKSLGHLIPEISPQ